MNFNRIYVYYHFKLSIVASSFIDYSGTSTGYLIYLSPSFKEFEKAKEYYRTAFIITFSEA